MKNPSVFTKKYRFCPECKEPFGKSSRNLLRCKNGHHFYINPCPSNGLILENKKGEILLVKRKVPPNRGYWDTPGGFVDFFENSEESLVREVKEELGIIIKNFSYVTSMHDDYQYKGITYSTLPLIYYAKINQQKIKPSDDISGYKWFKKSEIPYGKLAFDGLINLFKEFTKQK